MLKKVSLVLSMILGSTVGKVNALPLSCGPVRNGILLFYAHLLSSAGSAAMDEFVVPFAENWKNNTLFNVQDLGSLPKKTVKKFGQFFKEFVKRFALVGKDGKLSAASRVLCTLLVFALLRTKMLIVGFNKGFPNALLIQSPVANFFAGGNSGALFTLNPFNDSKSLFPLRESLGFKPSSS